MIAGMQALTIVEAGDGLLKLAAQDPDEQGLPREYEIDVRFDGCVHLYRYHIGPVDNIRERDPDYLHICDLDEMIALLQAVKAKALEHFGEWPR